MVRLMMILLGVDYLRARWRALMALGWLGVLAGIGVFIDALDGALGFPMSLVAWLLLVEGMATLAVAWTGIGAQRSLRYLKGCAFVAGGLLILMGRHHGNMILSMIFGALFLVDGALQAASAFVVRYRTWRLALAGAVLEILLALFFFQPYPTRYVGTVAYCVGLGLMFGGWNLILLASRVRKLRTNPAVSGGPEQVASATDSRDAAANEGMRVKHWDSPPADHEHALTVHVWTPVGSSKAEVQRQPLIDRYIAAVDRNGVISTGHAALETPEGVYISLYPAVEIDRSPDDFSRLLRATRDNDVPGLFQPDYLTESKAWCPSTVRVRIRNYDAARLAHFWQAYRDVAVYNLTYRNCSSTVSKALEAALEGATGRLYGHRSGWLTLLRLLATPEMWVAAQIRKRAVTMAWTPGLTLDYARALSMVADPRPYGWLKVARYAVATMHRSRQRWHIENEAAATDNAGMRERHVDPPAGA